MPKLGDVVYLGDGVYAVLDASSSVRLSTSNGIHDTNVIYMETEVIDKLKEFLSTPITL